MFEMSNASVMLQVLLAVIGFLCVRLFNQVSLDLRRLADSVDRLNVSMAGVVVKTENLEKRVSGLEERER